MTHVKQRKLVTATLVAVAAAEFAYIAVLHRRSRREQEARERPVPPVPPAAPRFDPLAYTPGPIQHGRMISSRKDKPVAPVSELDLVDAVPVPSTWSTRRAA